MIYHITAGTRSGAVTAPASKSMAHRRLIACALSGENCSLHINGLSDDLKATINCLCSLGSSIREMEDDLFNIAASDKAVGGICRLNCGESGSTLRFILPIVAALGKSAVFSMKDGLARRPIDALTEVIEGHGGRIRKSSNELFFDGQLLPGEYFIPGNISSQYISGLLFALPLLNGTSFLRITGNIESENYILMTEGVLKEAGIYFKKEGKQYVIPGNQRFSPGKEMTIEADWSNAAFFLCMGALSLRGVTVNGLKLSSVQGDKEILSILKRFGAVVKEEGNALTVRRGQLIGQEIDAAGIPDLIPVISSIAACAEGTTRIKNAARLRLKESDRLETTAAMLTDLGAYAEVLKDGLVIHGKAYLEGGRVCPANDHRIAMAAAVAAAACRNDVIVTESECVRKSYPEFWKHFESLEVVK